MLNIWGPQYFKIYQTVVSLDQDVVSLDQEVVSLDQEVVLLDQKVVSLDLNPANMFNSSSIYSLAFELVVDHRDCPVPISNTLLI